MAGLYGLLTTGSLVSPAAGEVHWSAVNCPENPKGEGLRLRYTYHKSGPIESNYGCLSHWKSWIPLLPFPIGRAVTRLRPFLGTEPLRHPVDVAVRCLGWRAALPAGLEETGPVCAG